MAAALGVSIMKSVWVVVEIPVQACGGWRRVWGASTSQGRPLDDPAALSM